MGNGLAGKAKGSLGFPEPGCDKYLELTLAMKPPMWWRVSKKKYTPAYIQRMLAIDRERQQSIYGVHLKSIEMEVRPNT